MVLGYVRVYCMYIQRIKDFHSASKITWTNQIYNDIIACKSDWSMWSRLLTLQKQSIIYCKAIETNDSWNRSSEESFGSERCKCLFLYSPDKTYPLTVKGAPNTYQVKWWIVITTCRNLARFKLSIACWHLKFSLIQWQLLSMRDNWCENWPCYVFHTTLNFALVNTEHEQVLCIGCIGQRSHRVQSEICSIASISLSNHTCSGRQSWEWIWAAGSSSWRSGCWEDLWTAHHS